MAVTTNALVSEFVGKLNTGSGYSGSQTSWVDVKGDYDLTVAGTNGGWVGDGSAGSPYAFDTGGGQSGACERLTLGTSAWQDSPFSLELWVYIDNAPSGYNGNIFKHETASSGFRIYLSNGGSMANLEVTNDWAYSDFGANSLATGSWKHLVLTYASSSWLTYLAGSYVKTLSHSYTVNTTASKLISGDGSSEYGFDGKIATIRWYSKALSSSEVAANYNAGVRAASTDVTVPTVTGVSPSSGPVAGGTTVVLTGTNFTGATAVHFGNANASSFTVDSATQITVTSPQGIG